MVALMIYDHAITFGQEVEFFWYGPWSLSKVLYLLRTAPRQNQSLVHFRHRSVTGDHATLPSRRRPSRVVSLFPKRIRPHLLWWAASVPAQAASFAMLSSSVGTMETFFTSTSPMGVGSPGRIVWLYVPTLIVHTVMFALKVYRFAQGGKSLHVEAPLRRFLKEGMLMYLFAMGSLVFSIVCLSFTGASQLSTFIMALASLPSAAIEVAVCRAMLSIRSLAATFHVHPEWLLNNAEMSRLQLRGGPNKSVLCVEIYCPD
ncbi:hypothetical protein EDC04DRAFT_958239 [Pisolithus marmoratus]|nr:hypothetical protein EDC04DRAFT_958239 [Pisolithus marmoratus]